VKRKKERSNKQRTTKERKDKLCLLKLGKNKKIIILMGKELKTPGKRIEIKKNKENKILKQYGLET